MEKKERKNNVLNYKLPIKVRIDIVKTTSSVKTLRRKRGVVLAATTAVFVSVLKCYASNKITAS